MASVQVGAFCYADAVSAGAAACAAHVPSATVVGVNVVQLSCSGVSELGGLLMQTSVAPVDGSASAVSHLVEVSPSFAPCSHADYVAAFETIFVAVLVAWVAVYGLWRVRAMLGWGRGEGS